MFYATSIKPKTDMKITNYELGNQAYKKVKSMILTKKLQHGQKKVQEKLSAHLGISLTPLRTALQMLEAESLVESLLRRE
jgi:DNA-binding GntR family transcriptional regulator